MKKTNIPDGFPFNGETCFLEGSTNLNDYLHGGFSYEARDNEASIVLSKLIKKYGNPTCGRNRATFIGKNFVIKFPLNDDGEMNNSIEANFNFENTAKGKSFFINGFTCLIQERLIPLDYPLDFSKLPEWTKSIDSGQVGYDSEGVLKAYDFAEDIDKLTIKYITKKKKIEFNFPFYSVVCLMNCKRIIEVNINDIKADNKTKYILNGIVFTD